MTKLFAGMGSLGGITPMELPAHYPSLSAQDRRLVRERYAKLQDGLCKHCGEPLDGEPASEVFEHRINLALFPPGFLNYPVHLHHDHETGMTLGAVHAQCNAVLWQFFGE